MRTRLVVVGAVALIAGAVAVSAWWPAENDPEPPPDGPAIVVVQMNLCGALGCYGEDVPDRMEVVDYAAGQLGEERADLALLNEVCFDQVDELVRQLRDVWAMSAVTVETLATGNGCAGSGYGNAVLHRGTLVETLTFQSCESSNEPCLLNPPAALSGEQRAMVCARVRPPSTGGADVTGCSVHLVPRGGQRVGERTWDQWNDLQLRSLRELVGRELDDGGAVVVGADLNAGPDRALDGWPDGWVPMDTALEATRPVPRPRRKIDYVMLSPALATVRVEPLPVARCPSSRLEGRWCTDHRPVAGTVVVT